MKFIGGGGGGGEANKTLDTGRASLVVSYAYICAHDAMHV